MAEWEIFYMILRMKKQLMNEARCLDIMYRIGKVETPIKFYLAKV